MGILDATGGQREPMNPGDRGREWKERAETVEAENARLRRRDKAGDALVAAVREVMAEPATITEVEAMRKLHALVAEWESATREDG